MPISFILSGILLILIISNVIVINKFFDKLMIVLMLFFVMFSYTTSFVLLGDVYVNFMQVISLLISVFYIFKLSKFSSTRFLSALIVCMILYLLVSIDLDKYLQYFSSLMYLVFLCFCVADLFKYRYDGVYYLCALFPIVRLKLEINEFTFGFLNFDIFYELMILFWSLRIIFNSILYLIKIRRKYEKVYCNYSIIISRFANIFV